MEPAAVLAVIVKAQGVGATNAQLQTVQSNLKKTEAAGAAMAAGMTRHGKSAAAAGKTMTKAITVPMLAIGTGAVLLSRQYGGAMRLISTQAGASRKEMERMKKSVLELVNSGKVKQSPKELAEALFHIESVGYRGAKAMEVLKNSADLATLGQSDMEATTYALVSALETGIKGTENMEKAMGTMNAIVGAGDLRMEDLTQSLSSGVLIAAKGVGLSLQDVGAAIDVFTARGTPATVAATRLRMVFNLMSSPTEKAKKALKGIGLDSEAMAKKMQGPEGLIGAVELLKEHLGGLTKIEQNQLISEAFGGAKSGTTIQGLIQNIDDLKERFHRIGETTDQVKGKLREAVNVPGFKMDVAVSKLEVSLIKLGDQILPVIVPVITDLGTAISAVGTAFALLPHDAQKWVVMGGILLAVAGPLLTIYGKLIATGGKFIGWIIAQTTATQAAAVANTELALSLEAVTAAQTELLIANKSGVVTGSVPIAPTAPAAAPQAAKGMAGSLAGGLARFLPFAIAAVGIGNIVSSAVQGDSEGALHKAGGAAGGALIGGILGSVVPGIGTVTGALVGGGIGSLLGGLIESTKQLHPLQEKLAKQTKRSADAFRNQRDAVKGLKQAQQAAVQADHKKKDSAQGVTRAHRQLNKAVHQFGPASKQAHEAELELARAQHKDAASARAAKKAHEQSKNQQKLTLLTSRETVAAEKARIPNLKKVVGELSKKHGKEQNNVPLLERLIKKENELSTAHRRVTRAIKDVAAVNPKQAQQLRHMTTIQGEFGTKLHGLVKQLPNFAQESKRSTATANSAWGRFGSSVHTTTKVARKDIELWEDTIGKGVDASHGKLAHFAAELGIKGVNFGTKQGGGKGGGKKGKDGGNNQRGGPIRVPGMGTGDTVPLSAMVEPGEVIHVLNSRASKDRKKLAALENLNERVPRFQSGGTLGTMHSYPGLSGDTDFDPALGFALSKMARGTGNPISVSSGYRSIAEQAVLYAAYLAGTGNLAAAPSPNAPHVRGFAADIAPDAGTFGSSAGNYGLGFTVPGEAWHIELLNRKAGAYGAFSPTHMKMPGQEFTGPPGMLTEVGQGVMDSAQKMGQDWLDKHQGAGGGVNVATGPVQEMAKAMVSQMWGGGQWGPFSLLEMSEAGWDYTAVNPSSGAAGLAQALPPSKYPAGAWPPQGLESAKLQLQWMMGYIKERYGDPASAWAFHQANNWYQKGGTVKPEGVPSHYKGLGAVGAGMNINPAGHGISESVGNILEGYGEGKHLPKYKAQMKKLRRRIEGIGLTKKRISKMGDMTKDSERFAEFASNASTLSVDDPNSEKEIPGVFRGHDEVFWLNEQLKSLMKLRGSVIGAHHTISDKQLPRVTKLMQDAKTKLRNVQHAIREAETKKREIEKKIKDVEQAQKKSKQKVEAEIKDMERSLSKAQSAKKPDKATIEALREGIKSKKAGMGGSDKDIHDSIKAMKDQVDGITKANKARSRVEGALTGELIPSLEGKQSGLRTTASGLYSDGAEVKKVSFMGLQQIQGAGGPLGAVPNPPVLGELGGEVFNVQNRLREIGEDAQSAPGGPSETELEVLALQREMELEWKKKYLVSQAQYKTISNFPTVGEIATMSYAGSFAKGGVMMAEVGEKGREIIAAPQGSRVIPKHEANAALEGGGAVALTIDQINIDTEAGTAEIVSGDKRVTATVKEVNRKNAKGASKVSPGSRRRRP